MLRWSINASQGSLLSLYAFLKIFFTISADTLALLLDLTCLGDDIMCLDSHSLENYVYSQMALLVTSTSGLL